MGMVYATKKGEMDNPSPEVQKAADSMKKSDAKDFASTKHKGLPNKVVQKEESNPRIPRKKGQPAGSKKHSDLYTDENPKGTIHGLGFKDVATAKASVSKIRNSSRSHAHKIQAAVAMEQRAREMGKTSEAAVYRKFINTMKEKTKKMNEAINPAQQAAIAISKKNRLQDLKIVKKKKKSMSEKKDHEHSMIRSQLSTIMRASQRLKKKMKGEGDVEAWVQSKITKAADYIDTAADYVDSGEVNEEGLRNWFGKSSGTTKSGRKVKGWVQVGGKYDGKPCARQPGQKTTPKCTSSSKRASMSDKERDSARRRKVAADPGQPQKSGAAKPTMVSTDPKKKMKEAKELPKNVKGIAKELDKAVELHSSQAKRLRKAGISEAKDKKGKGSGTKDACYHKVKSRYSVWPSAYASGALVKCRKVGAANWGNSTKEEFVKDGISFQQFQEKCWKGYEKKGMKTMFGKRYPNCVKKEETEVVREDDMKGMSVKSGHKRPTKSGAGMTKKGVEAYRRRNPGSKLKTAVTTPPSKLKAGSKSANRRKSYCARSAGQMKKFPKAAKDPDSRLRQARRRWNC